MIKACRRSRDCNNCACLDYRMAILLQLLFSKLVPCLGDPTVIIGSVFHTFKGSLAPDAYTKGRHALFLKLPLQGIGLFASLQSMHFVTFWRERIRAVEIVSAGINGVYHHAQPYTYLYCFSFLSSDSGPREALGRAEPWATHPESPPLVYWSFAFQMLLLTSGATAPYQSHAKSPVRRQVVICVFVAEEQGCVRLVLGGVLPLFSHWFLSPLCAIYVVSYGNTGNSPLVLSTIKVSGLYLWWSLENRGVLFSLVYCR